jgi:hypothetical protein
MYPGANWLLELPSLIYFGDSAIKRNSPGVIFVFPRHIRWVLAFRSREG